jgi:hypothetical protein
MKKGESFSASEKSPVKVIADPGSKALPSI